jgi:hypothetical protein
MKKIGGWLFFILVLWISAVAVYAPLDLIREAFREGCFPGSNRFPRGYFCIPMQDFGFWFSLVVWGIFFIFAVCVFFYLIFALYRSIINALQKK